jgi:hypothetical protein
MALMIGMIFPFSGWITPESAGAPQLPWLGLPIAQSSLPESAMMSRARVSWRREVTLCMLT